MNILKPILPLILYSLCLATACKKNDESTPAAPAAAAVPMSVTIDGKSWSAVGTTAEMRNESNITITGTSSDNSSVRLYCDGIMLKEYALLPTSGSSASYNNITDSYNTLSTGSGGFVSSGKITITRLDTAQKKISGTFSFSAADYKTHQNAKQMTSGVFTDISYTKMGLPPHPKNKISAKIDGVLFTPDTIHVANAASGAGVQINARAGSAELVINLMDNTPGTYTSNPDYTVQYGVGSLYGSSNVVVTISSYNTSTKELKGVFSFTAGGKSVTEGSFDVYRY